jgi:transposase
MLETDFYERLLGLAEIKLDSVTTRGNKIEIYCHTISSEQLCKSCGKSITSVNQYTTRVVRDLDIVGKEVWLIITVRQMYCPTCNKYFTESLGFADSGKSYTHRQSKWVFDLCSQQPFSEVGALINMCAKTVENLYFSLASARLNIKDRFKNVRRLGIDEISHRKGKKDYCCVLTDLDRGIELDILPTRKKDAIIAYFKDLGVEICHQIEVVACDIWEPYILVAKEIFPNATVTLDRFHVVKLLNNGLDSFRKALRRGFAHNPEYKKIKWVLFKQPKNCSSDEKALLDVAFSKCKDLKTIYELRNDFNRIYDTSNSTLDMVTRIDLWVIQVKKMNFDCLMPFVKTLQNWKNEIANFAKNHVTNAATEGLNNLIRHMKRLSFGMPNFQHMRIRVLMKSA